MEVVRHPAMDDDIVSTLGEIPRKFIRELYRLTTYMKILTDSTIISFDAWYRFILEKVYNVDMHIKHFKLDIFDLVKADEFGDRPLRIAAEKVETRLDYDFYTDEVMEVQRMIEPCKLDPQDALKYSIINTIAYVCSDLIVDYLNEYSKLTGSYEEGVRCRMIMKNEFYFLSALLTPNRRNYADYQSIQEGNIIPESERLAVMGLIASPFIVVIQCLNLLKSWEMLRAL